MKVTFITENFLLHNKKARELYFEFAEGQPIIDYHNHLPPAYIAENHRFASITEAWLAGDHYKWRAMRAHGVDEAYITGDRNDWGKFEKWSECVPYTMRNPLYHWAHLELLRYFDINQLLDKHSAREIYDQANERLQRDDYSATGLLKKMNVKVVCTTDDPADDLSHHRAHRQVKSGLKMLPGFRPDRYLLLGADDFPDHIGRLGHTSGKDISDLDDLTTALRRRIDYFQKEGCCLSDHGLTHIPDVPIDEDIADSAIKKRINGEEVNEFEKDVFLITMLSRLATSYYEQGWVMQFHLGALRNNSARLSALLGADVGADSIGDFPQAEGLSRFLNYLDANGVLPKTVLYNLNPADNEVFATMCGNFNDGNTPGKMQWGSGWWFLDQIDGMEKQMNTLSNMGLLSHFIGMLTDSRSFLSFPRHEYFRRILCNLIGEDVEKGLVPDDIDWLGEMIQNICYDNAKRYFDFA